MIVADVQAAAVSVSHATGDSIPAAVSRLRRAAEAIAAHC